MVLRSPVIVGHTYKNMLNYVELIPNKVIKLSRKWLIVVNGNKEIHDIYSQSDCQSCQEEIRGLVSLLHLMLVIICLITALYHLYLHRL